MRYFLIYTFERQFLCVIEDRTCLRCTEKAYFYQMGICKGVDTNCYIWDLFDGYCLSCCKGYNLKNGLVFLLVIIDQVTQIARIGIGTTKNAYNALLDQSYIQMECVFQLTVFVDTFYSYGACKKCYKGHNLYLESCVASTLSGINGLECSQWVYNQNFLVCSPRWIFGANGFCVSVDNFCSIFDKANGICTACYKGYTLTNGIFVLAKNNEPNDICSSIWDRDNQKCFQCSQRFYFNQALQMCSYQ